MVATRANIRREWLRSNSGKVTDSIPRTSGDDGSDGSATPKLVAAGRELELELLKTVLELTSARIGYYDLSGRLLYATPALASDMGRTPEELIGRSWHEFGTPPEAIASLEAVRRRVIETGQRVESTSTFGIAGSYREYEYVSEPVVGPGGTISGTVVTVWDTTEFRRAERRIAQLDRIHSILIGIDQVIVRTYDSERVLSEACRIAAEIGGFELAWIGLVDPETGDVRVAGRAGLDAELLDTVAVSTRDEPSGRGVVGAAIREDRTSVVQDVASDERMRSWRMEVRQHGYRTAAAFPIRVAGRPIGAFALYSSEPSHFDTAEVRLFEQLAGDISYALDSIEADRGRAAAQAALVVSEAHYRELFEKSPQCMWVFDTETLRFLAVNDAAVQAYGYSRDEFLGMSITDIRPPEDVPALLEDVAQLGSGYRPRGLWHHRRKDGTAMDVEIGAHDIDFNERPGRLIVAVDVTERRRLEAQLAEATRLEAMGLLAGGIAHDFNNLLTAVNGYADILVAELGDDERAESAREIRRAGARAAELTKQVLSFARRQTLVPRPIDVNTVVASVGAMLRRLIGEEIELATRASPAAAIVRADPGQLEQVLVNLAVNSRDAMPDGGKLEIAVRLVEDAEVFDRGIAGPAVLLTVADTGTGMDSATLARAFEPFFTTKGAGHGTGLGLATVYGIVRQSNGAIWAESDPGCGTRTSVLLPLVEASADTLASLQVAGPERGEGSTILVVEDDPAVRAFVVGSLEHAGYRVLVAGSSAQAVALTEGLDDTIDLLLTDLVMPGGNGRALAERLLARRPLLQVVLMSGYDLASADGGIDGRFRFLAKPFGADELTATVRQELTGTAPQLTG